MSLFPEYNKQDLENFLDEYEDSIKSKSNDFI
jgi:hypothetical protein